MSASSSKGRISVGSLATQSASGGCDSDRSTKFTCSVDELLLHIWLISVGYVGIAGGAVATATPAAAAAAAAAAACFAASTFDTYSARNRRNRLPECTRINS